MYTYPERRNLDPKIERACFETLGLPMFLRKTAGCGKNFGFFHSLRNPPQCVLPRWPPLLPSVFWWIFSFNYLSCRHVCRYVYLCIHIYSILQYHIHHVHMCHMCMYTHAKTIKSSTYALTWPLCDPPPGQATGGLAWSSWPGELASVFPQSSSRISPRCCSSS